MITKNVFLNTLAMLATLAAIVACSPKKTAEPSAQDYAPYIQAYTGGIVSSDAAIRVDLTEDAAQQVTDGLFRFKPAVKGDVKWNSGQSVSFIPADDAFKVGQAYQVSFALGQLIPGAPETFDFGITVKGKTEPQAAMEQAPQYQSHV